MRKKIPIPDPNIIPVLNEALNTHLDKFPTKNGKKIRSSIGKLLKTQLRTDVGQYRKVEKLDEKLLRKVSERQNRMNELLEEVKRKREKLPHRMDEVLENLNEYQEKDRLDRMLRNLDRMSEADEIDESFDLKRTQEDELKRAIESVEQSLDESDKVLVRLEKTVKILGKRKRI